MPGFILNQGTQVQCAHGGRVQLTSVNPQVTVNSQPIAIQQAPSTVSGCGNPAPSGPCVINQWVTTSTKVTSMGMPVLLFDSQSICASNGTPVTVSATQNRVTAM
ncbi:MAG: hypothetical protein AAGD25_31340 [Cyanobacteria bacterium P01_F01_bin.150]